MVGGIGYASSIRDISELAWLDMCWMSWIEGVCVLEVNSCLIRYFIHVFTELGCV